LGNADRRHKIDTDGGLSPELKRTAGLVENENRGSTGIRYQDATRSVDYATLRSHELRGLFATTTNSREPAQEALAASYLLIYDHKILFADELPSVLQTRYLGRGRPTGRRLIVLCHVVLHDARCRRATHQRQRHEQNDAAPRHGPHTGSARKT
jgi:hypothetical protein